MDTPSSTSKVTVTYWDPFSLFPLISSDLRSRLPLRNLHWKAPARPLRSINSLHVELSPYHLNPSPISPAFGSSQDLTRVKSSESSRSIDSTIRPSSKATVPPKERRHQIPGLRNTPYLKVFLLRCDDNDTYKATSRKLLREWVSEHTASSSNENKQHDAFEWLIIHVVLPNTPAALQPRSSSSASNASGSSRWMKGSTTLLDKIRSDFNSNSSKKDRIVQIRISPTHPALATLSPPVLVGNQIVPVPETPTESEMAWLDLIAKFKTQILASFDARVGQYEDDIREKDSQRRLPGWNFCTFFVLKEGLARAFESVGLVEDSLVLYDELGFGLDAIARDQEEKGRDEVNPNDVVGGKFVGWTKESIWWIEKARNRRIARREGRDEEQEDVDDGNPLGTERKHYRELILSNEISLFDFKCYLFARQSTLLLRLGKGHTAGLDVCVPGGTSGTFSLHEAAAAAVGKQEEDLTRLAEVCRRGLEFVTCVARALRADLWTAYHSSTAEKPDESEECVSWMVDNIVSSWIFTVCEQLLNQTATSILVEGSFASPAGSIPGKFPRRTSSLPPTPNAEITSFGQVMQGSISGLEDLAAARADLMLLARGVVETFGKRKGWIGSLGWFFLPEVERGATKDIEMEEVSLDDDGNTTEIEAALENKEMGDWGVEGTRNETLRRVIEGGQKDEFYKIFEDLSEKAMTNFGLAKRIKSCERVEADLAALRFHLKDYARAASHLEKMTKFYADQGWGLIETTLLGMYAKCLKEMDRKDEYVRVLMKLLAKSSTAERVRLRRRGIGEPDSESAEKQGPLEDYNLGEAAVTGYVSSIVDLSKDDGKEISTPMSHFWSDIVVDPYPRHIADRDGFEVVVKMRYLLKEEIQVQKIRVRIVNTIGQVKEVWMETEEPTVMKRGVVRALVRTNFTIPGTYVVDRIILTANKLTFFHELMAKTTPAASVGLSSTSGVAVSTAKKPELSFFPAPRNLLVMLEVPKKIHLDHSKATEIVIDPGENEVLKGELRVRSATAGLRLMTADLQILEGEGIVERSEKPGVMALKNVGRAKIIRLRIPYTSENDLTELSVKVEVDYMTEKGYFFYADKLSVAVVLPLAVNVQDVFKPESLFSRFQVSTAIPEMPLRILKATLEGSISFEVKTGRGTEGSMVVFAKQPASFTYKITRRGLKDAQQQPLSLMIEYRTIGEEIHQSVISAFTSHLKAMGKDIYRHWLQPILISQLRKKNLAELEAAALLDVVRLGCYEDYGWEEALEGINPNEGEREKVESLLRDFYKKNALIQISSASRPELVIRCIVIPVEVPQLQVIHTVEINILSEINSKLLSTPYTPQMVAVGQAIPAELVVRHSRSWNSMQAKDEVVNVGDEQLEFFYEVQNNLEVWLVSGRKRAHFTAKEGQVHHFPILLVPLKAGNLLLPNVEVKQYNTPQQESEAVRIISSETDYKSNGESVLVLPDVRSTTIRIDSGCSGEEGFRSPATVRA